MPGTKSGGVKAMNTNKARYGENFPELIGAMGGKVSRGGGFAANRELARIAGAKGGKKSKRPKALTQEQKEALWEQRQSKVDPLK
jgi:general stress protein YciG